MYARPTPVTYVQAASSTVTWGCDPGPAVNEHQGKWDACGRKWEGKNSKLVSEGARFWDNTLKIKNGIIMISYVCIQRATIKAL